MPPVNYDALDLAQSKFKDANDNAKEALARRAQAQQELADAQKVQEDAIARATSAIAAADAQVAEKVSLLKAARVAVDRELDAVEDPAALPTP